jgi:hypothetical protein
MDRIYEQIHQECCQLDVTLKPAILQLSARACAHVRDLQQSVVLLQRDVILTQAKYCSDIRRAIYSPVNGVTNPDTAFRYVFIFFSRSSEMLLCTRYSIIANSLS